MRRTVKKCHWPRPSGLPRVTSRHLPNFLSQQVTTETSVNEYNEYLRCNVAVNNALLLQGLKSIDVAGDDNCLFRAAALPLEGSEIGHASLRQRVVNHIEASGNVLGGLATVSSDDGKSFTKHIKCLRSDGCSVGEDAIMALALVCNRDVIVFTADVEPLTYSPPNSLSKVAPLILAFYEPGHNRAVLPAGIDDSENVKNPTNTLN